MKTLNTQQHVNVFRSFIVLLTLLITGNESFSAAISSNATGNWNAPATWNNNAVPTARTGTINALTTSNVVTGTGTLFLTELSVGNVLKNGLGGTIGTIASITSNTSLTLTTSGLVANLGAFNSSGVGPSDDVTIANGHTVTVNVNSACASLTITGTSTNTALTHNSGISLTITNGVTINQPTTDSRTNVWNINAGSASAGGSVAFAGTGTSASRIGAIAITTGTLTVSGNITFTGTVAANKTLSIASGGTLNIAGNYSSGGTLNAAAGSTVHYNGSSSQAVFSATYGNLTFSNAGVKTFSGNITVAASNTFLINASAIVDAGTFQVSAGGATATVTINGTLRTANLGGLSGLTTTTINSTNTTISAFATTSTIEHNSTAGTTAAPQFISVTGISGSTYGNIILSGSGVKQPNANFLMLPGTSFTLNSGVSVYFGTRNVQSSSPGTGTVTFNINGTFETTLQAGFSGGSTAINGTGTTINLGANSVIHYSRTTAQSFSARSDYRFVRISGASTKTMQGNVTVADSLNIVDGDLAINGNTLTINGLVGGNLLGSSTSNLAIGGTTTAAAISFTQTGTDPSTVNNMTITRASGASLVSPMVVAGVLSTTSGPLIINAQTLTLNGTVTYGTAAITGGSSSNLTIGGTGNFGTLTLTSGAQSLNNFTLNRTSSGNVTLGHALTISGAATVSNGTLSIGSNTLTLNGNVAGMSANGTFSSNGSSNISIGGSGALSSSLFFNQATAGTTNRFSSFTYNRASQTITLGNALEITGTVTPTAGTLATGGNLTLISNASGTGRIASGTGAYISGNVTAQRYIPSIARRWRFLSSPMSNATLEDWRGEIFITGPGTGNTVGSLNSNGFDATQNNHHGIYTYNEATTGVADLGWTGVTNATSSLSSVTLAAGRGYRVLIRGDRSSLDRLRDTDPTQNTVTLSLTGTVNTGNIVMPVSYTNTGTAVNDGWCLVGNPYPSQYDWNAFYDAGTNRTNISPTVYVYDPSANNYRSFNASSNVGTLTNGLIAQGQSFFIQTTGTSPALTFTEQYKTASSPVTLFKTETNPDEMHITLLQDSLTYDDFILKFMAGSVKGYEQNDILKMSGAVNISSYASDSIYLSADVRPVKHLDTVLLSVIAKAGGYKLVFPALPDDERYYYLSDAYLDTIIPLSSMFTYPFAMNTEVKATYGNARFSIITSESPLGPATGLDKQSLDASVVHVWPNPAKQFINISSESKHGINEVALFTVTGQLMLNKHVDTIHKANVQLNVSTLKTGIYLLKITYANNATKTVKVAVEE